LTSGEKRLRVGVVGAGYFGRFHALKFARHPLAHLVGIADHGPARVVDVAAECGTEAYTDHAALLGAVDAVSIATPAESHARIAEDFLQAGAHVLSELQEIGDLRRRDVQQAGFLVLKSPDIPSILVETAYISNPQDERRLADPREQQRLASSILAGLHAYFLDNPPAGTRLARRAADPPVRYNVLAGDTLSAIADRFQVTVAALRSANALDDDGLRTGQVLAIPLPVR